MKNKSSPNQVKLPFGLRRGELVHIDDVPSGLVCECYCAACHARLIAKKGKEKAHHFAHYQAEECEHAVETALHLAAKKVLEQAAHITLPELVIQEQVRGGICGQTITKTGTAKVCEFRDASIDAVRLEDKCLAKIIPDVIADIDGSPFIIEIAVTHFVDDRKEAKIHHLNIASIEIDLSEVGRNADLESIRSLVVDSISHKVWLFHPETEKVRMELKAKLEAELQAELNQIYEKEQERKKQEEQKLELRLRKIDNERRSIQPYLRAMDDYCINIENHRLKFAHFLPRLAIWKRATLNMGISAKTLPFFLNHPVKGENIFACDRRAWQTALFSVFIYGKFQKYNNPYPISVNRMIEWCQNYVPLNRFGFELWLKKEFLEPATLATLQNFNLYKAVREFAKHLEEEGFIEHFYDDKYIILIDRLFVEDADKNQDTIFSMNGGEGIFNRVSKNDQENFRERVAIMEFCGGLTRAQAENLAYEAIINS
jgi:hypothetical protein